VHRSACFRHRGVNIRSARCRLPTTVSMSGSTSMTVDDRQRRQQLSSCGEVRKGYVGATSARRRAPLARRLLALGLPDAGHRLLLDGVAVHERRMATEIGLRHLLAGQPWQQRSEPPYIGHEPASTAIRQRYSVYRYEMSKLCRHLSPEERPVLRPATGGLLSDTPDRVSFMRDHQLHEPESRRRDASNVPVAAFGKFF